MELDPVTLQRVDRLLAHLDVDQRAGTPGDMLKTAILDLMDDSARQGQIMAGKAVAAILAGDLLVVENEDEDPLEFVRRHPDAPRARRLDDYIADMESLTPRQLDRCITDVEAFVAREGES
jgi:hypothetical protein